MKSCPTCNLAEFVYKEQHHWYCRLQSEEEAGGQSLARRLAPRQEHGITATGHNFTILTPPAPTFAFTAGCKMRNILLSARLDGNVLPLRIQLRRLREHRCHLKLVGHVADAYSHLGGLDDCVCVCICRFFKKTRAFQERLQLFRLCMHVGMCLSV